MAEETGESVVLKPGHIVVTDYSTIKDSEVKQKFEAEKEAYFASKAQCSNEAERRMTMKLFLDVCKDLALEAEVHGEEELQANIDRYIKSLNKRSNTYRSYKLY